MTKQNIESRSTTKGLGLGSVRGKIKEQFIDYEGRLECPVCTTRNTYNLIERRADFWECRQCGFLDDVTRWKVHKKKNKE